MYPVNPIILPTALQGVTSGNVPAELLVDVGDGALLEADAAAAWRDLVAAAAADGIVLEPGSCYRSYGEQETIFRSRYTNEWWRGGTPREVIVWRGMLWYRLPRMDSAAPPGGSNHGLGLAVDVLNCRGGARVDWLVANEEAHGWSHEIFSEPWHIRYTAGDRSTAAPVLVPMEDDMNADEVKAAVKQAMVEALGPEAALGLDGVIRLPLLETFDVATGAATYKDYPVGAVMIFTHQEEKLRTIRATGFNG